MRRDDKYIQRGKPPCTTIRKTTRIKLYTSESVERTRPR